MICPSAQGWRYGGLNFLSSQFGPELSFWRQSPPPCNRRPNSANLGAGGGVRFSLPPGPLASGLP